MSVQTLILNVRTDSVFIRISPHNYSQLAADCPYGRKAHMKVWPEQRIMSLTRDSKTSPNCNWVDEWEGGFSFLLTQVAPIFEQLIYVIDRDYIQV